MSDSKVLKFFVKHPDTVNMTFAEFATVKGSPQVTPPHFYKMRRRFLDEYEVDEKPKYVVGDKKARILEYLQELLKSEGGSAVEKMDYERFFKETKVEVTEEWFRQTARKFLKKMGEETNPPELITINEVLTAKIRELKALLTQLGYSNIRIIAIKKVDVEL